MVRIQRLASSWWLGLALALAAAVFVFLSWRSVDFASLSTVTGPYLLGSGLFYGSALMLMTLIPQGSRVVAGLTYATMSAHLFKYVPGSIWQGQRLVAVGGMSVVFRFAFGVLTAAGLGLAVSGRMFAVLLGLGVIATALGVGWRSWGLRYAVRMALLAILIVLGVAMSGAVVGAGAHLDPWWSARQISGAWGLGVLAVPVPAGLGIRELFLSLSDMPAASAQIGLVHRVVTLAVDTLVGGIGFLLATRRR